MSLIDESEDEALSTPFPIPRQTSSTVTMGRLRDELRQFRTMFEQDSDKFKEIKCPLIYWKFCFEKIVSCGCLKPLILCLFGIPATSDSSERMFSKAGKVISRKRARMLPEMAQDLVLISEWSKQPQLKFMDCLTELVMMRRVGESESGDDDDDNSDDDPVAV